MKFQAKPYSCGAAAVVNAAKCLGRNVSESKVRGLAGTTEADGTSEEGIVGALNGLGFTAGSFGEQTMTLAIDELKSCLQDGEPVIICTQNAQHWVTVAAAIDNGRRFLVIDPANTIRGKSENGVFVLSRRELVKTWQCRHGDSRFFLIWCRRK